MSALYERRWSLVIGDVRVTGLRMQFSVKKNLAREPNTLDLTVTNLSKASRAALQEKDANVILEAGYKDNAQVIFVGTVRRIASVKSGADWETRFLAGDGEARMRGARTSESFGPGTGVADVLGTLAENLVKGGKKVAEAYRSGKGLRGALNAGFDSFTNGIALQGPVAVQIDKVLEGTGYTWSIQDGVFQLRKMDEPPPGEAILLSPQTGLVGSPEFGELNVVNATSLLQPDLRPGRPVRLESEMVRGLFEVYSVTHTGDTHGPNWHSACELWRL